MTHRQMKNTEQKHILCKMY